MKMYFHKYIKIFICFWRTNVKGNYNYQQGVTTV